MTITRVLARVLRRTPHRVFVAHFPAEGGKPEYFIAVCRNCIELRIRERATREEAFADARAHSTRVEPVVRRPLDPGYDPEYDPPLSD